jgi:hypothetical protein
VNGIALGVLELKRSTVSVAEGIRQNLDNQRPEFIRHFFATVQLVFAGNDSEGLRYAPILTPQPYWLAWKEPSEVENRLDRDVGQMLQPESFLEIIHDFTVFDAGIRKACRPNQYFAVKAAQERISQLLIDLVAQRKKDAISYAVYLERIAELVRKVKAGHDDSYPDRVSSPGKKALYDNLDGDEELALKVDEIIRETAQDGFRSSARKQRLIRNRLAEVLNDEDEIDRILDIIMAQDEY